MINYVSKKGSTWNPATCTFENGEYLAIISENSVINCNCVM